MKSKLINLISWFLCRFINKQDFFIGTTKTVLPPEQNSNKQFYDIDNYTDYKEVCDKYNFSVPDADVRSRFENKQHFCVITEDGHYGCWGWYTTTSENFKVTEIAQTSPVPQNATVLFHYYTNESQRRKGYYFELLKNVVAASKKEYAIIYAYDTNFASSNAIKKAGFHYVGRMKHSNFVNFQKMISMYDPEGT